MENSWEWVDQFSRRERFRKRFRLVVFLLLIGFLIFTIGVPRSFRSNSDAPSAQTRPGESPVVAAASMPDQARQLDQPGVESFTESSLVPEPNPVRPPDITTSAASDSSEPSDADRLTFEDSDQESTSNEARQAAEHVLSRLDYRLKQIDGDAHRLQQFGGQRWTQVESLQQQARQATNHVRSRELAEAALQQLDALAEETDYAEFRERLQGKNAAELLTAVVDFQRDHPDHPRLNDIETLVTGLSREQWLALAVQELEQAPPDDAGFAEGWLPIAGAWQLVGNDVEAREAIRRAREALPRMTQPERIIESTMDICQHESFDVALAEPLLQKAAEVCEQVSDPWTRGTYLAHLAGLSNQLGLSRLSDQLLQLSMSQLDSQRHGYIGKRTELIQKVRTASWTALPEEILTICDEIEEQKGTKSSTMANVYGYVAIAAARHRDRTQFLRAMFRAENELAPDRIDDYPEYLFAERLAEANLLQRRWRAAVIIANNIPDPSLWASILFRVMIAAPQEVRCPHTDQLFTRFGNQRWAAQACAAEAEHRWRSGESPFLLIAWTSTLPLASLRAAAYAGIARTQGASAVQPPDKAGHLVPPDISDPVSLVQAAEQRAHELDDPLDGAFAWLQIARTWNLLGKTTRYQEAVGEIDNCLFNAWNSVWIERPPVKQSFDESFIYASKRHEDYEQEIVGRIVTCLRHVSEIQADLGDAEGAMETCLNLANAAGFLSSSATFDNQNYLHLKSLSIRLQTETGVGPDVFPFQKHLSPEITRAALAALSKDVPGLEAALAKLIAQGRRIPKVPAGHGQPARGYGELALIHAGWGNLDKYRDARRSAESLIAQDNHRSEVKLLLAAADAIAGEFALAEANLVSGTLHWYGDVSRPRSQLAVSLAHAGHWQKALEHANHISRALPLYRGNAWEAVAQARFQDEDQPPDQLLEWVDSLESSLDQVAACCGLARAATDR